MPGSIMELLLVYLSILSDIKSISNMVINANSIDIPIKKYLLKDSCITINKDAPSPAPDDMPKLYAEARGFLNTDCITAPVIDREAPANNDNTECLNLMLIISEFILSIFMSSILKIL